MGTPMAPAYANLFMGDLEEKLLAQFALKPYLWWRYTDDIFMVWTHGEDKFEDFINDINSLHSTIKFTHEFSKSHIPFLDVTVSLDNNKGAVRNYRGGRLANNRGRVMIFCALKKGGSQFFQLSLRGGS